MKTLKTKSILFWLLITQVAFAQQQAKYTYSLGGEVFKGFILRHHEYLGHLIKDNPSGFSVSAWQHTYGAKAWEANYGYPDVVFNLGYFDLKNDEQLGKVIVASTGMNFHLLGKPPFKNELQFYFGLGLAYSTNPYDQDNNNLNNVISTPITYNANLKFSYHHWIKNRLGLGVGVKLTHFSNGSMKLPNNGLNIVSANLEVKYKLSKTSLEYIPTLQNQSIDRKVRFGAVFRIGWSESPPVGSGAKPVYAIGLLVQKRVSLKSLLDFGLEAYANKSIEYEIAHGPPQDGPIPDYKRLGLMIGHELVVNRLALVTQVGYYLYKPYYPNERIYSRIGLNYYFNSHIYAGLSLKTHFAVAEAIEYGIGFRW